MSYFDRSEFAPYVELCRELRLERHGVAGDWRLAHDPEEPWTEFDIKVVGSDGLNAFDSPHYDPTDYEVVWLPRLDQWLDMLEVADPRRVDVFIQPRDRRYRVTAVSRDFAEGSSREEAAARLWMALMAKRATP